MNEQCKRERKIEYARFPAVNGKELDISSADNVTNKKMTRGVVEILLSRFGRTPPGRATRTFGVEDGRSPCEKL